MPTDSISTVGIGGDYSTIETWQSGVSNKDLVTRDVNEIAEIIGGSNVGNPTARIFIAGWTTDATRRVIIRAQAGSEYRGTGVLDTSKAYLQGNFGSSAQGMITNAVDITLENVQLDLTSTASGMKCLYNYFAGSAIVKECLFRHEVDVSVTGTIEGLFFEQRNPGSACNLENNIMIGEFSGNSNTVIGIYVQGSNAFEHTIRQNTLVITGGNASSKTLLSCRDGHDLTTQNNYLAIPSNSTGDIYASSVGSTITKGANDATSNTEATTAGLQSVPYDATVFAGVTSGSEDLTPVLGGTLFDAGADLTSVGVVTDIVGASRPVSSAYDIGAVELAILPFVKEISATLEVLTPISATLTLE